MNEIVFVRNRLNVVDAQFFHHGMAQGKVYSWYLPSYRQPYTHVGQVVRLHQPGFKRNVQILALHFELQAESRYQSFPAIKNVNGGKCSIFGGFYETTATKFIRSGYLRD